MLAQAALLVENVAAHLWLLREQRVQCRADGRTLRLAGALADDTAQPGREVNLGHGSLLTAQLGPQRGFHGLQRGLRLGAVGAAGLRHIGLAAAAFPAERLGRLADEVHGRKARYQIRRDADDDARLAVLA